MVPQGKILRKSNDVLRKCKIVHKIITFSINKIILAKVSLSLQYD